MFTTNFLASAIEGTLIVSCDIEASPPVLSLILRVVVLLSIVLIVSVCSALASEVPFLGISIVTVDSGFKDVILFTITSVLLFIASVTSTAFPTTVASLPCKFVAITLV